MVVDDTFKGSPLENNPPYWYLELKYNEEYYESYYEEYDG